MKCGGGGVVGQIDPPPEKSTLKNSSLIRLKKILIAAHFLSPGSAPLKFQKFQSSFKFLIKTRSSKLKSILM